MTESLSLARPAPGPKTLGVVNYGVGFVRDPFATLNETTRRFGPIVRFELGGRCLHLIHEPKHVQHVLIDNNRNYEKSTPFGILKLMFGRGLLFNEGASWFAQRRLLQPSFQPRQFAALSEGIADVISSTVGDWPRVEGAETDIEENMSHLTHKIIGQMLFGTELSPNLANVLESIGSKFTFFMGNLPRTPQNAAYRDLARRVDAEIYATIAQRRAANAVNDDMLGILMTARDKETGEGMSDTQLRDEIVTLLFSGFDTTSRTLSWVFHALAENPAIETALHEETDRVLQGRAPRPSDLANLPYTQMVIKETMRLFPANPIIGRSAKNDDEIDGHFIPGGSFITLSPYLVQRSPKFWENPEVFDPYRFSPEREKQIEKFAYFPFGGGPRQCIGKGLAMTTLPLAIATIAARYRFASVPGVEIKHDIKVTFQSRNGIRATRHLRPAFGA
ncbi:cytochrome P450 [Abditibacterium utsteinense]|nr:cytochrome P450 [Abditibacterium utsteinense]